MAKTRKALDRERQSARIDRLIEQLEELIQQLAVVLDHWAPKD